MADGQILIDSRIQIDGAKKDTQDLKKQLESLADSASASAKKIEKSFDSLSIEDAAEGLGESFEREAQEVEDIPDQIEKEFDDIDLEDVADGLADGFGEEADKTKEHSKETEKAIEALTDKIKRQEKELGTLKTAYINARSEYGETADETQRLAREIEELSTELKQSQQEFEDASKAADHLDKTLDDINPPEGMQGFMEGFIGGIASGLTQKAIDMLGEIGRAMIELGKAAVAASAEVQASNAQFSQAFKGIEESARSTLEGIAAEAGIISTRMQDSYTKIYSFLKTLGTDSATALDISARAMRVAADQAAYYDKSIEEVTESLQSFLKGNYENDAALGIAATETTRNAKANEMYAKSFQKLSESQKVDVLLAMVEAGNEASGAIGQAAREADSWENVTGNLSEAWRQFLAVIGEPILNALIPIVQGITESLQFMTEALDGLQVGTGFIDILAYSLQNLGNTLGIASPSVDMLTMAFDQMGLTAQETATQTDQLTQREQESALAAESTATAVDLMRQEYDSARESAKASLDSQIGLLTELKTTSDKSAKDIISNWADQKAALEQYTANMQKAVDMGLDEALVRQLSDGSQESMQILQELVTSTDTDVDAINEAFRGVEEAKETVSGTMADIQTDMSGRLAELAGSVESEWGTMATTVGASISEMQGYINSLQGKDVYVNVITRSITSGNVKTSGVAAAPNGATPRVASAAPVPYLASGAVIPPNAPFMAMLGDQRNGTNLEAPEGLIRNLFREEMSDLLGSNLAGFEAVVAELQATRSAIEDIQIGDTTIGRAAARYDRRQNLIRGGSTG